MNCLIVARWVEYSENSFNSDSESSRVYLVCQKNQAFIYNQRHAHFHRGAEEETYTLDDVVAQVVKMNTR